MLNITLIAGDLKSLAEIRARLDSSNLNTRECRSMHEALIALKKGASDIALVCLPENEIIAEDQFTALKSASQGAIVLMGDDRDEVQEVIGLRLGADDYVTKSCSNRVLIERLHHAAAMHKIRGGYGDPEGDTLVRGHLELSFPDWTVRWRGKQLDLTVREFNVLHALVQNPGHVKSRNQIMDHIYKEETYVDDRNIDSYMKRIRQKFREVDPTFDNIKAVYGVGYKYTDKTPPVERPNLRIADRRLDMAGVLAC